MVVDLILRRSPAENLRESLASWLGGDRTFAINNDSDETFKKLDMNMGAEVDVLIAGARQVDGLHGVRVLGHQQHAGL